MTAFFWSALLLAGVSNEPYLSWTPDTSSSVATADTVGQRLTAEQLAEIVQGPPALLPYRSLTCGVRLEDGTLWLGTPRGLIRHAPGEARCRLFHSRRWLPADDVQELAVDSDGSVRVRTSAGAVRLVALQTTLDQKIATVEAALRKMHVREGLVGDINLKEPGRTDTGWHQPSSDNDGLWTSIYVAAEAYRYAVTGDPEAKKHARQSLEALMFLERVTGISGFVARSIWPVDQGDAQQMFGGEWHRSADGRWWWKGDTSSDELDGHYFAYAVYYDVAATDAEREEIRGYVGRITDHLLDHGYYYVGPSGKPTRWGVFAPEKLNHDLRWIDDRGLNSLEMLSHLKVAAHMLPNPRYADAARELIEKHAYATNTVLQKWVWPPESVNHSDDELAFLVYHPLLQYERDPELSRVYLASLSRSWEIERPEHSPLFNYIYAASLQAQDGHDPLTRPAAAGVDPERYDHDACVAWFRDVPADSIIWTVHNSEREDLGPVFQNRFDRKRATVVLPPSERPHMRWNGDPYTLDGGADGRARDDGAYILLPYWMGRYHRFLD